jgi:gamma-glutamyltranspeptidase/glutathione hydrolase
MPAEIVPTKLQRRRVSSTSVWFVALVLWAAAVLPCPAASRPAERGPHGMVVSPDGEASRAGVEVLRAGGNAVDASVAVAFALSVTYPLAATVGGGGFMLYRTGEGDFRALDFRETAPEGLRPELLVDEDGRPIPGISDRSGLAVGVPGSVAGLAKAHDRWGTRPWAELLQPAIRLAREGFEVSPWLASGFAKARERLLADPEARRIFAPDGTLPEAGDRLVQSDLARTLRTIAKKGPQAFYRGKLAEAVAHSVRERGGVMQATDLADYRPVSRDPLAGHYRGYRVVSFPPPSSGGVALLQILGMLEPFDLRAAGAGSSLAIHLIAEAERRAFADRFRWLGDPDFVEIPLAGLLAPDYLARRAAGIDPDRATPSSEIRPGEPAIHEPAETMHLSVADEQGGAVALTITLNFWFGAAIVAEGTGVLLNNEIDDFSLAPGVPNAYGLIGGEANAVVPRKRPLSSMTPTIVERAGGGARPLLILGTPGGPTIISSVLQVLVNVIDHEMPLTAAVDAPRFHHQWQPDLLRHEIRAFPADVRQRLLERGHELEQLEALLGNVSAIGLAADGAWLGAADPWRQGTAAGY